MEELDYALEEGALQLHRIKDVRDELNILKTVAKFQLTVRSKMAGETNRKEDLQASYVLSDIVELDNNAKQMQEAFINTLSLQESEIANFQAQESVKQGKTVMVFTVVTVWFLPLSFLTSLFALDVSSFLQAPAWALYIIFTVPLLFLGAAGIYMYNSAKHTRRSSTSFSKENATTGLGDLRLKGRTATHEAKKYFASIKRRTSRHPKGDIEDSQC